MPAPFSTAGLARASASHPWRVLALWLLLIVLAVGGSSVAGGTLSNDPAFTDMPDSRRGEQLIEQRIGTVPLTDSVVVHSDTLTVDDAAFRQVVQATAADLAGMTDVVAAAPTWYDLAAAGMPGAGDLVSADRHTTLIPVTLVSDDMTALAPRGAEFVAAAQGHRAEGIAVYAVGDLSANVVYERISAEDMSKDLSIGLPVAGLVLVIVLGALVAAGIPLLLGIVSIMVGFGLTMILARFTEVFTMVPFMVTMIGLAVGIDYALFVVERFREERRRGLPKHDAIAVAGGTAGKAVLFSGVTVVVALLGMFLIPFNVFHGLATGAIIAVLVAMLATQTFVPAVLSLLGDRIDWPRRRRKVMATDPSGVVATDGPWARVARLVMGRPVVAVVLALVILVGLAVPAVGLRTGTSGVDMLPPSDIRTGYALLDRQFYVGSLAPVRFVIDAPATDPAVATGIGHLIAALAAEGTYGPAEVVTAPAGDLTVVTVPLAVDPNHNAAYDQVRWLRDQAVPDAFGPLAGSVFVAGITAFTYDLNETLRETTPLVVLVVLGLSFLLLMLAFRSLVVPLKAILLNLVSVGAAYGVLVAVFQHGVGAGLLGLDQAENIAMWIPVFLFCVLFGLSMDYHVFLLSRIREHVDRTGRTDEAIAFGLQSTGRVITGAALIMVVVFAAFSTGRLIDIQQMGFGLAVAIFLDATLVRMVLVPATMTLLGDRNWYLPAWLRWLPDLRIEAPAPGNASPREGAVPPAMPAPGLAVSGDD